MEHGGGLEGNLSLEGTLTAPEGRLSTSPSGREMSERWIFPRPS